MVSDLYRTDLPNQIHDCTDRVDQRGNLSMAQIERMRSELINTFSYWINDVKRRETTVD